MRIETQRLYLRELELTDLDALKKILQDKEVMYAYEHSFTDTESLDWLLNQLRRYKENDGFGLLAVCLKDSGKLIGQCGLTYQQTEIGRQVEIGYLFLKAFWHNGYATEAALACKNYAFETLKLDEVVSVIRDSNLNSIAVAKRLGMSERGHIIKHYYNMDMPHTVFAVKRGI